ncbi:MAG: hypothetical protein RIS70_1362, partial [Planctomycetota bacterium]
WFMILALNELVFFRDKTDEVRNAQWLPNSTPRPCSETSDKASNCFQSIGCRSERRHNEHIRYVRSAAGAFPAFPRVK